VDRRRFLKYAGVTAAVVGASAIGLDYLFSPHLMEMSQMTSSISEAQSIPKLSTTLATVSQSSTSAATSLQERRYSGTTLNGWEVILGDSLYAPPPEPKVTLEDIETDDYSDYSEVRANIKKRRIMAHNLTYFESWDTDAFEFQHSFRFQFKQPYLPLKDPDAQHNGETIEAHIRLYDGKGTIGPRALRYVSALAWVVNPWSERYGYLLVWTNPSAANVNDRWTRVANIYPDTSWHSVELFTDVKNDVGHLVFDSSKYEMKPLAKALAPWGAHISSAIHTEAVSIYPTKNHGGAEHKVQFRNWEWAWNPY